MSLISRLGENLEKLPEILFEYEKALENVKENLNIQGKRLETANVEHSGWQLYYESRKVELYALLKYFEARTAAARGKLFKTYTEHYSRELSDRQKDRYIDNDEQYLKQYEVYLEVKETFDKYEAVCNAWQSRGYNLNNITKIRVASLEDVTI